MSEASSPPDPVFRQVVSPTCWHTTLGRGLRAHFPLKMLAIAIIGGAFFLAYFLLLKHPLRPVTMMPVTALDHWINFWPGALWVYASLWIYVPLPPGLMTDLNELLRYYAAMVVLSLVGLSIFLVWPTASPDPTVDWMQYPPLGPIIAADDRGNALPSLHAAFAVFSGLWVERLLRAAGAPAWLRILNAGWGAAIVYSTLATRQHVAVDVIAGAALGWVAVLSHARCLSRRRTP